MYRLLIVVFICIVPFLSLAQTSDGQKRFTISGTIKNNETGETLIGAGIYINEVKKGSSTNTYGFYSVTLPKGNYTFVISSVGFKTKTIAVKLDKDQKLNISLEENIFTTETIEISAQNNDHNVSSTEMGKFEIPIDKVKALPALLGEVDVLKVIQLTPGVQSSGEGNSGFYVRGGGPDQNLILLDESVVYNASHLFGFFSVFNADALNNVELTKAGMPAQYGGRLASVLDISMKDGNNKKFHGEGGIGVISSRLTLEGPIKKDTSSFIISGRRTYADVVMKPFVKKESPFKGTGYYFYDLNAKLNYILSGKDRLFLSGYFGRDVFSLNFDNGTFSNSISWGNGTGCLRWNHLFSDKLFSNLSLIYSNYQFDLEAAQSTFKVRLYSGIEDWNAKADFTYIPSLSHKIKFGMNYIYHTFTPNNISAETDGQELDMGEPVELFGHDLSGYINDEFDISSRFKLNAGLRYTYFQHVGPFDRYTLNDIGKVDDTIHYDKGELVKAYNHPEPRLSTRFILNEKSSLKASYTINYQYIHLASLSSNTLPTDVWIPCSDRVQPQFGSQTSLGFYRNFKKNVFETYIEAYYKDMKYMLEFREDMAQSEQIGNNTDNSYTFGDGEAYGVEFFVKKRTGKTTGWVGYTLSWATRLFPDINNGIKYYTKYDRRHDVSVVLTHDFTPWLTASLVWVYATGNTMTPPLSRYFINGQVMTEYGERNSFRMPAYHRMDFSLTLKQRKKKKFESFWNLSVYNLYNRMNPYFIVIQTTGNVNDYQINTSAKQISIFPIIPSISWNFKF